MLSNCNQTKIYILSIHTQLLCRFGNSLCPNFKAYRNMNTLTSIVDGC